jgi:hypothetical protein
MKRDGPAAERLVPMSEQGLLDTPHDHSDEGVRETPLVIATRIAVGVALVGAAGVSALMNPQRRQPDTEARATVGPNAASLAADALVTAAHEFERGAMNAALIAGGFLRTTIKVARLTPLRRWIDEASARVDGWSERGLAEREIAVERVTDAWDALLGDVVGQVLRHIDVNEIAASVDVDGLAARVDVGQLLERVDLDAIAQRIDVEAIIRRVDLAGIAREVLDQIEVEEVIRESSGSLAVQTVDALRTRGAEADRNLARVVDRLLQRRKDRDVRFGDGDLDAAASGSPPEERHSASPAEPSRG